MTLTAYHGTRLDRAEYILTDGYKNSKETEWMGKGVYFFPDFKHFNGVKEAISWAKVVRRYRKWAILVSTIKGKTFLNLMHKKDKNLYFQYTNIMIDKHLEAGKTIDEFDEYVVFKYIDQERPKLDFIIASIDTKKRYRGFKSNIIGRQQVQLCVKNTNCIKKTIMEMSKVV
jgi:hypothetical protein